MKAISSMFFYHYYASVSCNAFIESKCITSIFLGLGFYLVQDPNIRPLSELEDADLRKLLPEIPQWVKCPDYDRVCYCLFPSLYDNIYMPRIDVQRLSILILLIAFCILTNPFS